MNIVVNDVALSLPKGATKEKEGIVKTTMDFDNQDESTAIRAFALTQLQNTVESIIGGGIVPAPRLSYPLNNEEDVATSLVPIVTANPTSAPETYELTEFILYIGTDPNLAEGTYQKQQIGIDEQFQPFQLNFGTQYYARCISVFNEIGSENVQHYSEISAIYKFKTEELSSENLPAIRSVDLINHLNQDLDDGSTPIYDFFKIVATNPITQDQQQQVTDFTWHYQVVGDLGEMPTYNNLPDTFVLVPGKQYSINVWYTCKNSEEELLTSQTNNSVWNSVSLSNYIKPTQPNPSHVHIGGLINKSAKTPVVAAVENTGQLLTNIFYDRQVNQINGDGLDPSDESRTSNYVVQKCNVRVCDLADTTLSEKEIDCYIGAGNSHETHFFVEFDYADIIDIHQYNQQDLMTYVTIYNVAKTDSIVFGGIYSQISVSQLTQPGEMGFGVGVYPGDDLADLGLQPMDGTDDPNSDNYGNYERTDGKGVMVFVPAFCYSFEPSEIPSNVTSSSGFGFKWFSEFDYNEQKANDAGYILHEAFLDGTETKSGFFIAKYLMSKGIKSVKGGIPISLCSSGSDVCSFAEGQGATGQVWDALTLSKTWGTSYNCASVYMYSALAMLSLVHGWHAKGTDMCAWYDATGTTNYPKGCNNGMLGDCDDTTILYENNDTQQTAKPNTGSANHFAKTTHNGQMSGVCDLNGCMEQVVVGFIIHGSTWYLRATNAKLVDYTKENVNTTDSAVYRPTSLFSGDEQGYWGKINYNAFFLEKNGDHRTLCGVVPNNNAMDGTNEFGSDRVRYEGSSSNYGAMCCGGWWTITSKAGVWKRYADSNNNNGWDWANINASWGFRCAAYGNK